jgi:hypothetical protein
MTGALISHLPVGATLHDWLMFGHVLAAMIWLGGWVTLSILGTQALRHEDPGMFARFAATMRFIGPRLFAPATVRGAGLGVWLVLDSHQWHLPAVLDRACDRLGRRAWGSLAILLLLLAATWDMTVKP